MGTGSTSGGNTTITGNANGTQVFNAISDIDAAGGAGNSTTIALCGNSFTGQAAHVTVSPGCAS